MIHENPIGLDGFEFVEFTSPAPEALATLFEGMGFTHLGDHRSKNVRRYNQGDINFILNMDPTGQAASFRTAHGPSANAMAFRVEHAAQALEEAVCRGAKPIIGFYQSKPASALSPVFVTPDALGTRWQGGKLHGTLNVDLNGQPFGRADAGVDMTFDFGTLVAHLAKTRSLAAGTIVGSGTVSNRDANGGPGRPVAAGGLGYSCIAEVRMIETILKGTPETTFLKGGDAVRIWMEDDAGKAIFGTIDQTVKTGR